MPLAFQQRELHSCKDLKGKRTQPDTLYWSPSTNMREVLIFA